MKTYYISNSLMKLLGLQNTYGGGELFSQPTFDLDTCEDSFQNKVEKLIFDNDDTLEKKIEFIFAGKQLINVKMIIDDKSLHLTVQELSHGTYGTVYKLHNSKYDIEFALKLEKIDSAPNPLEEEIGEDLLKYNCNTIRVKYIKSDDKFNYYIMDLVDGDLTSLFSIYFSKWDEKIGNLDMGPNFGKTFDGFVDEYKKTVLLITDEIRKQILCLYMMKYDEKNKGGKYAYLDLKFENILYKCDDDKKVKIHLGDLGSAVLQGDEDDPAWVSTYPPPETIKIDKNDDESEKINGIIYIDMFNSQEIKKMLSWQIGIILLRFMCEYESQINKKRYNVLMMKYFHSKISFSELKKINSSVIKKLNKFYNSNKIGYFLSLNIDERPLLTESLLNHSQIQEKEEERKDKRRRKFRRRRKGKKEELKDINEDMKNIKI